MITTDRTMTLGLFRNRSLHYVVFVVCLIQAASINSSDQVIQKSFNTSKCSLSVYDDTHHYALFRQKIEAKETKIVYFNLIINGQNLHNDSKNYDFYGWVKDDFSWALISLPVDYIATSLSLYSVFVHRQSLNLIESSRGCYARLTSDSKRKYIIFEALLKFTNSSGGCFGRYCPTIFWRRFNRKQELLHHPIPYSCCNREIVAAKINISTCLILGKQKLTGRMVQIISIIISSLIAVTMLDKLINNFLKELGNYRYCEHKSHLTSDESQDHSLNLLQTNNSHQGLIQEETYQSSPGSSHQIGETYLQRSDSMLPNSTNLTKMVKVLTSDSNNSYNQIDDNDQELLTRQMYLTPSYERQSYHQINIILVDMKHHLLSLQLFQFIKDLLTFIICLPFCIFGLIGLLRALLFISEVLTFKLKRNLLPKITNWPLIHPLVLAFMTFYSLFFVFFTASLLACGLQLISRIAITVITFIFAFSSYFNEIIIIVIPYVHFIYLLLSAYSDRGPLICQRIIDVKPRIEENIQTILDSKQGILRVDFIITQTGSINDVEIDTPEMLNEETIKLSIVDYIKRSLRDDHHHAINGTSSIVFQYSYIESDSNKVTVKLLQCGFGCVKCTFNDGHNILKEKIQAHLGNNGSHYFQAKLCQTYYDIYESRTHPCTGIPAELYNYLKYYTPKISISQLQVAFYIFIITGLFVHYIVTFDLVYRFHTFSSLNSSITHASIVYLVSYLSLKSSKILEIDKETIDKILILNITQYRRGYKIFFKRGIEFQPISQTICMAVR
ncbi:uncharacterized protein TRIADDRAFT_60548 [Trichoplax adhaerens]|uniref:Uncharacterized protein n=1 Tax=Trichoplax adhaerens TaxID=10228 RepID=B3S8I0_TRIAD|nr:predicted protein [Trichoplax adhaerens]EDV20956.1 predicted protein [Trichoplax adhaerens]|eukprot:XP_002116600.1 predicted protein [Trichoplax adhaerens]